MLCPCAVSFFQRLCSVPSPPVSYFFPEPHPGSQCCLYNLLEGQLENSWPLGGKYCIISNLILPSTGHAGDLGDAKLQSGGPRRSTCFDLPRDLVLKRLSLLNLLRDPPVPGLPGGCHASTCPRTQFSGGHHTSTYLGIYTLNRGCLPGSQVATVLGKIRFRKTHP